MKKLFYSLLVALFLTTAAEAAKISITPLGNTVDIGSTFNLDIVGMEFPGTYGGDLNLKFNPAVLNINKITLNSTVWTMFTDPGTIDNVAGNVDMMRFYPNDLVNGSFPIATVEFKAIGASKKPSVIEISESYAGAFSDVDGNAIPVAMENGSVAVNDPNAVAAPEPATISLLMAGLGLVGFKKTKK